MRDEKGGLHSPAPKRKPEVEHEVGPKRSPTRIRHVIFTHWSISPDIKGRGCAMTYGEKDFVKLLIYRDSAGRARWVQALRATADHYAWTEHFERWRPNGSFEDGDYTFVQLPGRSGPNIAAGGKRRRICWSKSLHGHPAGKTNQFTMSNSCRWIDYAELAHFSKGNWHWMTGPNGQRITRDRWEAIYETAGQNRGAGLVSA